jgi:hypothetical protein
MNHPKNWNVLGPLIMAFLLGIFVLYMVSVKF